MDRMNITEKELHPRSGLSVLLLFLLGIAVSIAVFVVGVVTTVGSTEEIPQPDGDSIIHVLDAGGVALGATLIVLGILGWIVFPILMAGLKVVHPNEARVLTLFGNYYGTIKTPGFFYVHPFCSTFSPAYNAALAKAGAQTNKLQAQGKEEAAVSASLGKNISLKTQTLDNGRQKVNDVLGNPIIIGAVVIWRVTDPTRAVFAVENYADFLSIQTDSTVRNIARLYPYDVFDEDPDNDGVKEKTLRGSAMEIAASMKEELQKRVAEAGLEIEEVRITHLAYAEEIAAAMLQRQQAVAIIAARQKIVDGAVGMVKMAIDKLGDEQVVVLDEERKAAMVSNLLVVLCGNKDAQPVLNSGSIY